MEENHEKYDLDRNFMYINLRYETENRWRPKYDRKYGFNMTNHKENGKYIISCVPIIKCIKHEPFENLLII